MNIAYIHKLKQPPSDIYCIYNSSITLDVSYVYVYTMFEQNIYGFIMFLY